MLIYCTSTASKKHDTSTAHTQKMEVIKADTPGRNFIGINAVKIGSAF